jgi:hypothetical protein
MGTQYTHTMTSRINGCRLPEPERVWPWEGPPEQQTQHESMASGCDRFDDLLNTTG